VDKSSKLPLSSAADGLGGDEWASRASAVRRSTTRRATWLHHTASVLYLTAGLLFRLAWLEAGKASASDDGTVAQMHRSEAFGD